MKILKRRLTREPSHLDLHHLQMYVPTYPMSEVPGFTLLKFFWIYYIWENMFWQKYFLPDRTINLKLKKKMKIFAGY